MVDSETDKITVIVPVFADVEVTRECIRRCLPDIIAQSGRLILINDASPDAGMQDMLEQWITEHPHIAEIIVNTKNEGFVASVNKGMQAAGNGDIVLLNSDVFTPANWLQTLRKEAASNERIGTVTPMSNNSTISSLPNNNENCRQLLQYEVDTINRAFETELPLVEAPTGIGFCMLIKARCRANVGLLDVTSFGEGYGEESDYCQRAIKAGFVNVLSPNLYCHHIGNVSFGDRASTRLEHAYRQIAQLHPNYHADVALWIAQDPLAPARLLRSLQINKQLGMPFILHVNHNIGGGPMRYVSSLIAENECKAVHIVVHGRIKEADQLRLTISIPSIGAHYQHQIDTDEEALRLITSLGIDCVHIHHLVGIPKNVVDWIQGAGTPYIITFHDYYLINGNPYLANAVGEYEGIDASPFDSLYRHVCSHPFSHYNWTVESQALIARSACNIFPSLTAYDHFRQAFSALPNARIVPHDNVRVAHTDSSFSVVALGALGLEKGADFIEKVATAANGDRHSTLSFKIIGYAYRKLQHVEQTGPYEAVNLQDLIHKHDPACIFFGSRCPETYSYTLSEAIESGLPIIAPMLGVFDERLSRSKWHFLYTPEIQPDQLAKQIQRFLEGFYNFRIPVSKPQINNFYKSRYLRVVQSLMKDHKPLDGQLIFDVMTDQQSRSYFL